MLHTLAFCFGGPVKSEIGFTLQNNSLASAKLSERDSWLLANLWRQAVAELSDIDYNIAILSIAAEIV